MELERQLRAESRRRLGYFGTASPSEKRATTGMVLPEKSAERLSAAASAVPTNSPAAQCL